MAFINSCLPHFSNQSFWVTFLLLRLRKGKFCQGWNPKHKQQFSIRAVPSQVFLYGSSAAVPAFHALPHSLTRYNCSLETTNSKAEKLQAMEISKVSWNPSLLKQMPGQARGELAPDSEGTPFTSPHIKWNSCPNYNRCKHIAFLCRGVNSL